MHERPHEKLIAWREAYGLCLKVYKCTTRFPSHEQFALTNQMRRAAYSVPLNIAEGNTKRSSKDKARFFEIARGSLEELHCQCRIAHGLRYLDRAEFTAIDDHLQRVSYLLHRLRSAIL